MTFTVRTVTKRFFTGIFMGAAGLMPGVSSGTVAVITGIYDDIMEAVSIITGRQCKGKGKYVLFLANIFTGVVIATFVFARFMDRLLSGYPVYMNLFFIGLVFGSMPMLYNRAKSGSFNFKYWGYTVLGFILVLFFGQADHASAPVPEHTALTFAVLSIFLAGFLSVGAGLIPGISGSMVLILIGAYPVMISALSDFDMVLLLSMGLGAFIGFLIFTRGINHLLQKHPGMAYFFIMGLFAGSAFNLWPELPWETETYVVCFFILAIGFSIAFMGFMSGRKSGAFKT